MNRRSLGSNSEVCEGEELAWGVEANETSVMPMAVKMIIPKTITAKSATENHHCRVSFIWTLFCGRDRHSRGDMRGAVPMCNLVQVLLVLERMDRTRADHATPGLERIHF